ncbi:MAG: AraC family transcriptional regulator, partial [Bdellovibrionales bacterium]|nr:AraC family transcriptional regulator [Massilia sp.]
MLPPDPLERDPRADGRGAPHAWLRLAPGALQGALVALVGRDTRSLALSSAQRLSHFPASPMVSISWYRGIDAGLIEHSENRPCWRPFASQVVISGSQSRPTVGWAPTTGRGYMACFNAD